jgi:hypothetical protein
LSSRSTPTSVQCCCAESQPSICFCALTFKTPRDIPVQFVGFYLLFHTQTHQGRLT